ERAQAYRQLDQQIKSVLGDQRYAEYQRSQDSTFRNLADIAQQDGLPKESAIKAYEAQKLARQEAVKVRSSQDLTPDQRQETLKACKTQRDTRLVRLLGPHGSQPSPPNNGPRLYFDRRGRAPPAAPAPQ